MIAIKDMEIPKNCAECNMTTCKGKDAPWNYVCSINLKDIDFNETDRAEHCPLVEIVTCKDCIHRDKYGCRHGHPNCKDNFYCADAERRE